MAKFIEFLKPDLKRIIVLLIILSPIILSFFHFPLLPVQFDSLNTYLTNSIVIIPLLFSACFLGGWDCGGVWVPYPIFDILTYSFVIIIWYFVSCLIVFSWDNMFGSLGKEKRKLEKIVIKSLIVIFILVTVLLPAIGTHFVNIETNTRQNVSFNEAFRSYTTTAQVINNTLIPIEQAKLQELRIQNHFISPVTYGLPNVTACVYDKEGNLKWGYTIAYRTVDGGYVEDSNPYHRNVIVAKPGTETKIYLQDWIGIMSPGIVIEEIKNNLENFDEIILLSNVGMNNYSYCIEATEEDILASEKIKISK